MGALNAHTGNGKDNDSFFLLEEVMNKSGTVPHILKSVRGKLITVDEVVKLTGLGKDWFYRHMKNGTLPFRWFPLTVGKRFLDSADIDDWLKIREIPAATKSKDIKGGVMRK